MPINNITQTISELPATGRRGVDVQTQFVIKQEDFQDHLQGTTVTELNTLKDQLNTRIGEINSTATQVNTNANTATTQAGIATTKASAASTSASQALTSRNQAETFNNSASTSASTATTKASEASASATSASSSASTATTKASEASASATSASTSASTATTKASEATTKASEASASATSASSSASTATTKASEASASATAALNSKNQASTFASNSSYSETRASKWADNNYNVLVEAGKYSAKHWATEAQNTVNTKVALTDFTGANVSLTLSGFQKLPSGLIIQWGVGFAGSNGTSYTNNFPIAFPTGCVSVTANHEGASDRVIVITQSSVTPTSFGAISWYPSSNIGIRWIAIGY